MTKTRPNTGTIKPGEVRNPLGGLARKGLAPFSMRVLHFNEKFTPAEIIAIADDPKRWNDFTHWDVVVLKRMAAQINGNKEEREETKLYLDRKEGKPVERRDVRVIRSLSDLTEEELIAIAAESGVADDRE